MPEERMRRLVVSYLRFHWVTSCIFVEHLCLLLTYRREERKKREERRERGRLSNNLKEKLPLNSSLFQVPCLLGSILGPNTASLAKGRAKPESSVRAGNARKISDTMDGGLFLIWTNVKSISSSVPKPPTSCKPLISRKPGSPSWEAVSSWGTRRAQWLAVLWRRSHRTGRQPVGAGDAACLPFSGILVRPFPRTPQHPLHKARTCVLTFARLLLIGEQ